MSPQKVCAFISTFLVVVISIPYASDIVRGRVVPARSTRLMMVLLAAVTLSQQWSLGSRLGLALNIGQTIEAVFLFGLAIPFGCGGVAAADICAYLLLGIGVIIWVTTGNALLALHISVLSDAIAIAPTVRKIWMQPHSETPLFYGGGVLAACFALAAQDTLSYESVLFPAYLIVADGIMVLMILRIRK